MTLRRTFLSSLGLVAFSALLASGPASPPSRNAAATLTWTEFEQEAFGGTWDAYTTAAAAYTGEGYTDWRLPTVEELQAALQDGSYGRANYQTSRSYRWTSKTQGKNYAYIVVLAADAEGDIIPEQSGEVKKVLKRSNLRAKFVRP